MMTQKRVLLPGLLMLFLCFTAFAAEPTEVKETGAFAAAKESVSLKFEDGSLLRLEPETKIIVDSLKNASGDTLIQINLEQGGLAAQVDSETFKAQAFVVFTATAAIIAEGPKFSAEYDPKDQMTTVASIEGPIFIQADGENIYPVNITTGEQVSFTPSFMGPIVAAGAPGSLEEPKELRHRLLDLGHLRMCETRAGEDEVCSGWVWDRKKQQFDTEWADKRKAVFKAEKVSDEEMVLTGLDQGKSVTYTGHTAGHEPQGDVMVPVWEGTITSQDGSVTGKWRALA